jgi:hypothetical protein
MSTAPTRLTLFFLSVCTRLGFRMVCACVISCKVSELRKLGYDTLQVWKDANPEQHVYIGRDMTRWVAGADKSKWCNEYSVEKYGLAEALRLFERDLRANSKLMDELEELRGCVLGCWCRTSKSPTDKEVCHGDVLLRMLRERYPDVIPSVDKATSSTTAPTLLDCWLGSASTNAEPVATKQCGKKRAAAAESAANHQQHSSEYDPATATTVGSSSDKHVSKKARQRSES